MSGLQGRTAVVTGGGRGIGRAIAARLATDGADVAVLARSEHEVREVADQIGGTPLVADVADAEALQAALSRLDHVDVLVNNAGVVWPLGASVDVDVDEWSASIAINLVAAFRATRLVLPGMLERGWGRVVNISSGAADPPGMPSATAYSVGKAGLDMLTRALAAELDGSGVTVNAVRPGVVDSAMQDYMRSLPREQVGAAFHERFHGLFTRGELIGPEAAADLVAEVVAGEATGQVLDVRNRR